MAWGGASITKTSYKNGGCILVAHNLPHNPNRPIRTGEWLISRPISHPIFALAAMVSLVSTAAVGAIAGDAAVNPAGTTGWGRTKKIVFDGRTSDVGWLVARRYGEESAMSDHVIASRILDSF